LIIIRPSGGASHTLALLADYGLTILSEACALALAEGKIIINYQLSIINWSEATIINYQLSIT